MEKICKVELLTSEAFAPFGTVLECTDDKIAGDNDIVKHWHDLASLDSLGEDPVAAFVITHRRDFIISKLERHEKSSEIFFPARGMAAMPFAVSLPNGDPDLESLRVFLLTPDKPFVSGKGVWHWVPFPLDQHWETYLLVEKKLIGHDIEERDLGIQIKIEF